MGPDQQFVSSTGLPDVPGLPDSPRKTQQSVFEFMDSDEILQILIEDQGVGFSDIGSGISVMSKGLGLFHLRERLVAIGGRLEIESVAGKGSKVTVSVPVRRDPVALVLTERGGYS
jgi:signal transduction histidine kinase